MLAEYQKDLDGLRTNEQMDQPGSDLNRGKGCLDPSHDYFSMWVNILPNSVSNASAAKWAGTANPRRLLRISAPMPPWRRNHESADWLCSRCDLLRVVSSRSTGIQREARPRNGAGEGVVARLLQIHAGHQHAGDSRFEEHSRPGLYYEIGSQVSNGKRGVRRDEKNHPRSDKDRSGCGWRFHKATSGDY